MEMVNNMPINTAKIAGRRQLQFTSLDDILADIDRLNQGKVRTLGNWTPGQNLKHLATVMNGSLDGIDVQASFFMRFIARMFKKRMLKMKMPAGFQLPKSAHVLIPADTTWEDGVHGVQAAIARLKAEPQRHAHPVLGNLTREQWDQLHCRHCELHLSFLVPEV